MEYRLLGSFEVTRAARPVPLPPGRARAVLALLLVHANEVVPSERIVEELWNGDAPPSAGKIVQNSVSSLRRALDTNGDQPLVTQGPGYVLRVAPGSRDVDAFLALLDEGRRNLRNGDAAAAADRLREALALWRGPPLAEFAYEGFAQAEISRLEELRLGAVEDRIDADLALGRHAELVPELEQLVRSNPLRERLRGQLVLALYRSGRQADALAAYAEARRTLLDELGLEPGRPLQELQRAILAQDPDLDTPSTPQAARRRRRFAAVALAAALAAATVGAVTAFLHLTRTTEEPALASASPNSVAVVEPDSGRLVAQVRVPGGPRLVAAGHGTVWIEDELSDTFTVLDERTRDVRRVVVPGIEAGDVAIGRDAAWIVDRGAHELVAVAPAYGQVVQRVRLPAQGGTPVKRTAPVLPAVAVAGDVVWVADGTTRLLRVDSTTGRSAAVDVGVGIDDVAATPTTVWAVSGPSAVAVELDPRTLAVRARVPISGRGDALAPFPTRVAIGAGGVWVLNATSATVTRIDPAMKAVAATVTLGVDRAPVDLAAGAGAAWTANRDGTLIRIAAHDGRLKTVALGYDPAALAVGETAVWTSIRSGLVRRVDPPRAAAGTPGALPASLCSRVYSGGGTSPDLLVALPLSLQGFGAQASAQIRTAVQLVFEQRGWRAGRFTIGFQACNDADRTSGFPTPALCAANARAYVERRRVVGVVGPVYSYCAQSMLPILNAAPGGPVPVANGLNTYVGLTRASAAAAADEPGRYTPSGRRAYVRVTATDDVQAAAIASFVQRLGARRVFVLDEGTDYGNGLASAFGRAALRLGLTTAGKTSWDQSAASYAGLAARVRESGADAAVLMGAFRIGSTLLTDLRTAVGPTFPLVGSDGFQIVFKELGNLGGEVEGLYVSLPGTPFERLGPRGRRFVATLQDRVGRRPLPFTVQTAAAAEVLLDAIARSDGTRSSVARALLRTRLPNGIVGPVAFTPTGDVRRGAITISRIERGRARTVAVLAPSHRLVAGASSQRP
jgi:DNA-binding SARP family transcriptional activator/ABC-type branched-subunit amino acid transport system substrate-binding protein